MSHFIDAQVLKKFRLIRLAVVYSSLQVRDVVSVALLTWVFMPWATKVFAWWLDPVEGAALKPTIKGIVILVILYAITLAIFLATRSLQFWDYSK